MAFVVRDTVDGLEWGRHADAERAEQARQQLIRANPALLGKLTVTEEEEPPEDQPLWFHEQQADGSWRRRDLNPRTRERTRVRNPWVF